MFRTVELQRLALLSLFYVVFSLQSSFGERRRYDNVNLVTVHARSEDALKRLVELQNRYYVDTWQYPRSVNHNASFAISDRHLRIVEHELFNHPDLEVVRKKSVQSLLDAEEEELQELSRTGRQTTTEEFDFSRYHRFSEIEAYLESVAETCSRCELIPIGQSYEGRELKVLKIGALHGRSGRPGIFIDAGIHAREWLAPATALFLINKVVHLDSAGQGTQEALDAFDWYIIPSINPDGYEHTWSRDRLWRKTRSRNSGSSCVGTDPNRNWDFHWMETGASNNPCSDTYGGREPFSEPETRAVSEFLMSHSSQLKAYLTFHCYGQYWLTPWGYTSALPEDYDDLVVVGQAAFEAIREYSGRHYTLGSSTNVLYSAAGGSDDWAKGVAGIKYGYTIELQDTGEFGFIMPRSMIKKQGKEMWVALKAATKAILNHMTTGTEDK